MASWHCRAIVIARLLSGKFGPQSNLWLNVSEKELTPNLTSTASLAAITPNPITYVRQTPIVWGLNFWHNLYTNGTPNLD